MSSSISPTTGKKYRVELVCHVGGFPRGSFYAQRKRTEHAQASTNPPPPSKKRGPKTPISDEDLLDLIRRDLKGSPWTGEGHRKVHARLKLDGVQVGRSRVLGLMRTHGLLSPHRIRLANDGAHDGTIVTDAPGVLWATDGTKVQTVEEGNAWIFCAVEHWNGECLGAYVTKTGNRFAALQPISKALGSIYGSVGKGVAQGLGLRMDHGCQYTSDDFLHQLRFWGITPDFGLVGQPETNGVAERFFRTLKEQAIYGRIFRTIEDLRKAVLDFVETYNTAWRLEKNSYLTPREMRESLKEKVAA